MVNAMDIAPDFAGIILGFSNSLRAIAGFLGAEVMGALTDTYPEYGAGWRYLFSLSAGLAFGAATIFVIFADDSVQSWAKKVEEERSKDEGDDNHATDENL